MDTPALPRAGRVARVTVATGMAALLLAACGASNDLTGSSASRGAAPDSADLDMPEEQADAEAGYTEEGTADAADGNVGSDVEITDRQLIHIAEMTVRVEDVAESSDLAKALAVEAGGYVAEERLSTPTTGTPESDLTLRIPNDDYESSLDALAELGDRSTLERSVQDVTEEVADVESRIESSEAALETLRGYLEQAEDVDDLLRVESEIQRRQEDLEAFQARLNSLENQTTYSTVHLTLQPPATYVEEPSRDSVGFLGGLERGWLALVALGQGLAVIAGWLLPFTVVAVVLGAWPLWLWRQRRRARRDQREQNAAVPAGAAAESSESGSATADTTPETDVNGPDDQR
ncbi:DUF4349 domain-containing protein [Nocardiopsis exhalans]|uniref:DUF4349 domain-containing protein n=1 Tax=Nocardiopsis exhalans TaxID=163604 RepID=A0ABY5D3L4_9ACTN|nr:DUF4349 domain-containing protein [Nocardiopsis exhalans]USY17683.1 DUF4349 domain-containing protein [Nocardiopsis exhalans]